MAEPTHVAGHPLNRQITDNFRRLRAEKGLTLTRIAELSGMSATGYSFAASGQRGWSLRLLGGAAQALEVTVGQLTDPPGICPHCHGAPRPGYTCNRCGAAHLLGIAS
jgi:transcriptional regulator with XRE-family HTH domain